MATRNFEVRMVGHHFDQQDITIAVGDTVSWINATGDLHSVTRDSGNTYPWTDFELGSGEFSERNVNVFNTAGVLNYHCIYHGGMVGSITVT